MTSKAFELAKLGNAYSDGALSSRNIVINGDMRVAQRGTQTNQTSGYMACDRFQFAENGASVITTSKDTDVPSGQGFASSLKVDVTTANASVSDSNYAFIRTKFEGQDLQHICKGTPDAKPLTLSFWVKSPKTGTHIVELFDGDNTRQVSQSYTVASANTWQYVSVLFPADTTGVFANDNNDSLQVIFWLMAGNTLAGGTLNTSWAGLTAANRAVGQVNVMDDVANNFYLTGVQLEVGDTATPFEHEPYSVTLQKCLRYYEQELSYDGNSGFWSGDTTGTNVYYMPISYKVEKRAVPTVTIIGENLSDFGSVLPYLHPTYGTTGWRARATSTGTNATAYFRCQWTADAEL